MAIADARPKLLVVDDDKGFCSILQTAFRRRGYSVHAALSIAQAREKLRDWRPDFAVLDLRLQDGCGLELISEIKKANPAAKVVILTGAPTTATATEAMRLGAAQYLVKPADIHAIELPFR